MYLSFLHKNNKARAVLEENMIRSLTEWRNEKVVAKENIPIGF